MLGPSGFRLVVQSVLLYDLADFASEEEIVDQETDPACDQNENNQNDFLECVSACSPNFKGGLDCENQTDNPDDKT